MNLAVLVIIINNINNTKNQIKINGSKLDHIISHLMSVIGVQYSPIGLWSSAIYAITTLITEDIIKENLKQNLMLIFNIFPMLVLCIFSQRVNHNH